MIRSMKMPGMLPATALAVIAVPMLLAGGIASASPAAAVSRTLHAKPGHTGRGHRM